MITATITVPTTSASLRSLINTAVSGRINTQTMARAYQVILTPSAATVFVIDSDGVAFGSTGNSKAALPSTPTSFLSPTGNQIALEEIFLVSSAGTETVSVIVLTM